MIETNCVIKRIEYQADHRHGFQILGITTRTCQDEKRSTVTPTSSGFIPSPPGMIFYAMYTLCCASKEDYSKK